MSIWQADFYYHSSPSAKKQWDLVICNSSANSGTHLVEPIYTATCDSDKANAAWLEQQILRAAKDKLPTKIQVFRPQSLSLISVAAAKLGIQVEATRNTPIVKQVLRDKFKQNPNYNPVALEKPPPQALPESLWGDEWQIANIKAGQIIDLFCDRPIPINSIPPDFYPLNLNLASDLFIPGIVVYGGRQSMQLARWIEQQTPAFINYIPTEVGKSGGFILETGLCDRWVFNTFESEAAEAIARKYEQNKQASKGLHFLLIQPDDSGMTTTAFWLLREVA
ncbi:MAG: Tab2/Atab2 family RNA-binding protein [Cyanobacteria bacterium J06648_1]